MISCGMDVRVRDSEHDVNISDSEQKITVSTTLDKVLEICGIVTPQGKVVPYSQWTDEQKLCIETLDWKGLIPNDERN